MEKRLKKYLNNGIFSNVSEKRSETMSAIRGKNNKSTELKLRMAFVRNGIKGWRLNYKKLPGTPDFYFENKKLAIFVDGCFWHGCPKCGHIPKTRSAFWEAKINRTIERDRKKSNDLKKLGIRSIRFWEHELKDIDQVVYKIKRTLDKRYKNGKRNKK